MGRMIDADDLIKDMHKLRIQINHSEEMGHNRPFVDTADIMDCVNNQPTAFDSEKAVKQLSQKAFERYGNEGMGGQLVVDLSDTFEIVCNSGTTQEVNAIKNDCDEGSVINLLQSLDTENMAIYLNAVQMSDKTVEEYIELLSAPVEGIICNEDICEDCPCNIPDACLLSMAAEPGKE